MNSICLINKKKQKVKNFTAKMNFNPLINTNLVTIFSNVFALKIIMRFSSFFFIANTENTTKNILSLLYYIIIFKPS